MVFLLKFGFNRTMASITILIGFLFFSIYPIVKIIPLITSEIKNVQYYIPKVQNYIRGKIVEWKATIEDSTGFAIETDYLSDGVSFIEEGISTALLSAPNILASTLEWVFIIPLFLFFMLKDLPDFKRKLLSLIPNTYFEKVYNLSYQFNRQLGDYILAKFIEASVLGAIITSGLLILDIRFALLLGLVAALTNVIPYLGPVIGTIPGILFVLAEYGGGTNLGAVALLYLIANAIDIAIIFPILVSKIVDLHPVLVVASVIIGSQLLGTVGMVVSIPVAAALKLIFQEIFEDVYTST